MAPKWVLQRHSKWHSKYKSEHISHQLHLRRLRPALHKMRIPFSSAESAEQTLWYQISCATHHTLSQVGFYRSRSKERTFGLCFSKAQVRWAGGQSLAAAFETFPPFGYFGNDFLMEVSKEDEWGVFCSLRTKWKGLDSFLLLLCWPTPCTELPSSVRSAFERLRQPNGVRGKFRSCSLGPAEGLPRDLRSQLLLHVDDGALRDLRVSERSAGIFCHARGCSVGQRSEVLEIDEWDEEKDKVSVKMMCSHFFANFHPPFDSFDGGDWMAVKDQKTKEEDEESRKIIDMLGFIGKGYIELVSPSFYVYFSSIFLSVYSLSLSVSIHLSYVFAMRSSIRSSIHPSIHPFIYSFFFSFIRSSTHSFLSFIYSFIHPSIHSFFHRSYLSIHPSIHHPSTHTSILSKKKLNTAFDWDGSWKGFCG